MPVQPTGEGFLEKERSIQYSLRSRRYWRNTVAIMNQLINCTLKTSHIFIIDQPWSGRIFLIRIYDASSAETKVTMATALVPGRLSVFILSCFYKTTVYISC